MIAQFIEWLLLVLLIIAVQHSLVYPVNEIISLLKQIRDKL